MVGGGGIGDGDLVDARRSGGGEVGLFVEGLLRGDDGTRGCGGMRDEGEIGGEGSAGGG